LASLAFWLVPAPAQTAQTSETLEEVIVTARRYATALGETPLSVSVLTAEDLRRSGASDIVDWFARVPGLSYSDDGWGGHRTTLRGITSGTPVEPRPLSAWYLDDAPMMTISGSAQLGPIGAPHPLAIDLARIEVLRGPQGTLFGSSALGGAVRQISNSPDPGRFYGWVDAGASTTTHGSDNYQARMMLNAPIASDRAALRIVGYRQQYGGYIDNITRAIRDIDRSEIDGGRLSVLWKMSPKLAVELHVLGQKRTARGLSSTDVAAGDYEQARSVPEQDVESWELYTLTVNYDMDWAHVTTISSYVDRQPLLTFDITCCTQPLLGFIFPTGNDFDDGVRDMVQELRLSSTAGKRLQWVAGAYYQVERRNFHQNWLSPGFDAATGGLAASFGYPDSPWHADYYSRLRQRAVFAEITYQLSPAWHATLGARWFDFTDNLLDRFGGLIAGGASEAQGAYRESGATPHVGLEYHPNKQVLVFFNAAQGFRPGGANEFSADILPSCQIDLDARGISFPTKFSSDSLWNYELGVRGRWPDGRLAADATVYHIDWRDMQTSLLLPSCGATLVDNVGRAASDGAELELTWRPVRSVELGLSAAYIDARLKEDAPDIQGENGERIATVPDWTLSVTARREFKMIGPLTPFVQGDYQYVGGAWSSYENATRVRVPSRNLVNLRLGVQGKSWEIELFDENAFDERGVLYHNLNLLGEWQTLVRPRTVGLRTRVDF
jgi:outer membrane receptor protein involved in Fe transport